MAGTCGENGQKRGPVKALHFNLDGTKRVRPKKRWKEVLERNMTAEDRFYKIAHDGVSAAKTG